MARDINILYLHCLLTLLEMYQYIVSTLPIDNVSNREAKEYKPASIFFLFISCFKKVDLITSVK